MRDEMKVLEEEATETSSPAFGFWSVLVSWPPWRLVSNIVPGPWTEDI